MIRVRMTQYQSEDQIERPRIADNSFRLILADGVGVDIEIDAAYNKNPKQDKPQTRALLYNSETLSWRLIALRLPGRVRGDRQAALRADTSYHVRRRLHQHT